MYVLVDIDYYQKPTWWSICNSEINMFSQRKWLLDVAMLSQYRGFDFTHRKSRPYLWNDIQILSIFIWFAISISWVLLAPISFLTLATHIHTYQVMHSYRHIYLAFNLYTYIHTYGMGKYIHIFLKSGVITYIHMWVHPRTHVHTCLGKSSKTSR